jgi:hypothetical protein
MEDVALTVLDDRSHVAARECRRLANAPAVIRSADDDDAIVGGLPGIGWNELGSRAGVSTRK